jgi:DNA repair exonuclease SbcCD ATPase subunit
LEGVIEINTKDQSKNHINYKCVEVDNIVQELMDVSSAVLQNVIFCKDKFDVIFDSTCYSKALEQVKQTMKTLKDTIKDYEKDEAEQKQINCTVLFQKEFKKHLSCLLPARTGTVEEAPGRRRRRRRRLHDELSHSECNPLTCLDTSNMRMRLRKTCAAPKI